MPIRSRDALNWESFNPPDLFWESSMNLIGGRVVRVEGDGSVSFARGGGFDTYNTGVTTKLEIPVLDGTEYLFPGVGGIILRTQGAPALGSLKINSATNGMIQFTATGNPGWSYGVGPIPGSSSYPNSFPTNSVFDFTLEGTSTNFAIPAPATPGYFRLIER